MDINRYLAPIRPENPADLGFPSKLVYEVALNESPVKEICEAYGLTREDFATLIQHPRFIAQYQRALEKLEEPEAIIQIKAMMISEEGLKVIYDIMSDAKNLPAIRLDAIKLSNAMAGVGQKNAAQGPSGPTFAINIDLSGGDAPRVGSRLRVSTPATYEHGA